MVFDTLIARFRAADRNTRLETLLEFSRKLPPLPTVRGFVALLATRLTGRTPAEVAEVPDNLLDQLGLGETLGMMRTQGLTSIRGRIKRGVRLAATEA